MPYADPAAQREYQRQWRAARRAEYLADKACVICGSTADLHVDHRDPALKISHRIWTWSKARRDAELAKCQVLCWPHHREKTYANGEHARGVQVSRAKLSEDGVREIRRRFAAGGCTKRGLGREFGVDEKAIRSILNGETWVHVS